MILDCYQMEKSSPTNKCCNLGKSNESSKKMLNQNMLAVLMFANSSLLFSKTKIQFHKFLANFSITKLD